MPSWPTFEKVVGSGRRESERRMGAVQQQRLQREGFRLEVTRAGKHYSGGSRKPAADSRRPTRLSCCGKRKCECSGRQDGNP
jgi:hypothetical protein